MLNEGLVSYACWEMLIPLGVFLAITLGVWAVLTAFAESPEDPTSL